MAWVKLIPVFALFVLGLFLYFMAVNWSLEKANVQVLKFSQKSNDAFCVNANGDRSFLMTVKVNEPVELRSINPVVDTAHSIISNVKVIVCKVGTNQCNEHHLPIVVLKPGTWDIYVSGFGTFCFKIFKIT